MRYGLSEDTILDINKVFARFPQIERVILYGSRAMGTFRTGSDIDLCLQGEKIDLTLLFQIELDLDGLNLPYKIDLSAYHRIDNLDLIRHIEEQGVVFYTKISPASQILALGF